MENGRTDNQILDAEPVKCQLGDRTFELKPQSNARGRKFRKECQEREERLQATRNITVADEMIDLIYEYDKGLADEREWISDNATDNQLVDVFGVIYEFACGPFAKRLPRVIGKAQGISEAEMKVLIAEIEKP